MQRDTTVLIDIARAARLILDFKRGMNRNNFDADLKTQSAVLHQLLVIGEAVKRLSRPFRQSNPDIPWSLIAGMRDRLIHGYDIVDMDEVWHTITVDIPGLLSNVEPLIDKQALPPDQASPKR